MGVARRRLESPPAAPIRGTTRCGFATTVDDDEAEEEEVEVDAHRTTRIETRTSDDARGRRPREGGEERGFRIVERPDGRDGTRRRRGRDGDGDERRAFGSAFARG